MEHQIKLEVGLKILKNKKILFLLVYLMDLVTKIYKLLLKKVILVLKKSKNKLHLHV